MLIKKSRGWEISENLATPEIVYLNRRSLIKAMGLGVAATTLSGMAPGLGLSNIALAAVTGLPAKQNPAFSLDRAITDEEDATTYTNFYEFGSSKNIWKAAQALETHPWPIIIDGMVEETITLEVEELLVKLAMRGHTVEERLYRHRCVEAWAMAVPWSGVTLRSIVDFARPTSDAKYIRFETFHDPDVASGQKRQSWYPWPYVEGLTIEEARNELAFMATGLYGKPMPNQNGAPIRLVVPWKYGFKGIKSIRRITFTDEQPKSFWEELAPREYGFWANVNPKFPHPRWSQAKERMLGTNERIKTQIYNGYEEWVAPLYASMPQKRKLFF